MTILDDARAGIAGWAEKLIPDLGMLPKPHQKEIRDPVHDTFINLEPYEVAIIDTPLFQRLRGIHQTALAYQVYPSAHHTRLEHSIGVNYCAGRMCDALNKHTGGILSKLDEAEIRLAGLLHDLGHGLFSHLSETMFSQQFQGSLDALRMCDGKFKDKSLGEILSYLIVTSKPFVELFQHVASDGIFQEDSLSRVAGYILGNSDDPSGIFKAQIISSSLDADKLDYFARDCFFTGIRAEIDVERLLMVLDIDQRSTAPQRHLVVRTGGVHHMEHIIFSKMQLFASVYHHQKIRALECGVKRMFEVVWDDPSAVDERLRFPSLWSLLDVSEEEFWVLGSQERRLSPFVADLHGGRRPPKRALSLSIKSVLPDSVDAAMKLWQEERFPARQREMAKGIQGLLKKAPSEGEFGVWCDFPAAPGVTSDAKKTLVDTGDSYLGLDSFFPTAGWVAAYTDNKLLGHVFVDDDLETRRAVTESAIAFLNERFGVNCRRLAVARCYKSGEADDIIAGLPPEDP